MQITDLNQKITLNPITLKFFKGQQYLEEEFQDDYFDMYLKHFRSCVLYSVLLYGLSGLIDPVIFPDQIKFLWGIKFLIIIPVFMAGYFFSRHHSYRKLWILINNFYILMTSAGFIAMLVYCPPPMNYSFFTGVIVCLVFGYTFIRSFFVHASLAGCLVVACYSLISVYIHTPFDILIHNIFYVCVINTLGMIICYTTEFSARREFFLRQMLLLEKRNVQNANLELEKRVDDRTKQLQQYAQQLQQEIEDHRVSEAEKRVLENKLIQSHKMESIGTLAGGIAHDFNNILSSILGNTELALGSVEKGSVFEKRLQGIYSGGKRAAELVRQILAFARQSDEVSKPVQVGVIAVEVLKFMRSSIPATIRITSDIQSDALVMGNPTQIHQVLMNVCTNAAHAMEASGGIMDLALRDIEIVTPDSLQHLGLEQGHYVEIKISDTGVGIAPEIIGSIFDPYFTTKSPGKGTGMGLAMTHGIVESSGGQIRVDSKVGKGTVFTIYLPVTRSGEPMHSYDPVPLATGTERILLVDDDHQIVETTCRILESLGYPVTAMTGSMEALACFQSAPHDFDLVITDMTMPDMTGDIFAARLLEIRPDIPVILCTGYSKKITDDMITETGIKTVLYKPIIKAELATGVRNVLDKAKKQSGIQWTGMMNGAESL